MRAVKGVYEQGTIRLLEPVNLPEQQEVTVLIPEPATAEPPVLQYAGMLADLTPEEWRAFEASLRCRLSLMRSKER